MDKIIERVAILIVFIVFYIELVIYNFVKVWLIFLLPWTWLPAGTEWWDGISTRVYDPIKAKLLLLEIQ